MFIIVVGQGKVGTTLSSQLCAEGHDIVTIDNDDRVLKKLQETLDVATLCGNGAAGSVLEEAGAARADLLIACTDSDEVNLLSCMVARKLGTRNTIARVRNPEYDSDLRLLKDEFHISLSINPELTCAREIFRILRFPAFLKRETFLRDKAELVELKVAPGSKLDGLKLMDLRRITDEKALICAVERQGEVTIPDGTFVLQGNDRISITAEASGLVRFMSDLKLSTPSIRKVMIVGGSRIAIHVARMLLKNKIRVTIIDNDEQKCKLLTDMLPEATILCGNGSLQEVLLEEGVKDTDAVLALTGFDEENLTISMFANYLKVPKTVTKIDRTEHLEVYTNAGTGHGQPVRPVHAGPEPVHGRAGGGHGVRGPRRRQLLRHPLQGPPDPEAEEHPGGGHRPEPAAHHTQRQRLSPARGSGGDRGAPGRDHLRA